MELVAEADGVAYYDDSKGTNVGAVVAALDGFPRPVVLIAGGRDKGGDYAPLAEALRRASAARAVLIGEAADKIAGGVRRRVLPIERARRRMEEAVDAAPSAGAARATPSCCRPPARASTCSATTPIAREVFRAAVGGGGRGRPVRAAPSRARVGAGAAPRRSRRAQARRCRRARA